MIVLLALVLPVVLTATVAYAAIRRWPQADPSSPHVAAHAPADVLARAPHTRSAVRRFRPSTTTGLALAVATVLVVLGTLAFAVLLVMVRRETGLARFDRDVATWASEHATEATTTLLRALTELGGTRVLFPLAAVLVVVLYVRERRGALVAFVGLVVVGQALLSNGIKLLVDRVRPDIDPLAGFSGPSFPSGHTTAAAACFAAFALVLGRRRSLPVKATLAAGAAAIGVAVGATRVLLGVHWLTDVLAGLALGWCWFLLCSVAFGGRLLRFGAPVEAAERATRQDMATAEAVSGSSMTASPPGNTSAS